MNCSFNSISDKNESNIRPPTFTRTYCSLRFPFGFCFCQNYLTLQISSVGSCQLDFSSFLRCKLEAHRKSCEQLQDLGGESLPKSYKQPLCVQSAQYSWQDTHLAAVMVSPGLPLQPQVNYSLLNRMTQNHQCLLFQV